jgi:hypothetical protein
MDKNGRPYTNAVLRERVGSSTRWWRLFVFDESAQAELDGACDGVAVSARGDLQAELYAADDGASRLSLSIVVNKAVVLK